MGNGESAMNIASTVAASLLLVLGPDVKLTTHPLRTGIKVNVAARSALSIDVDVKEGGKKTRAFKMPARLDFTCTVAVGAADPDDAAVGRLAFGSAYEVEPELFLQPKAGTPDYSGRSYDVERDTTGLVVKSARIGLSQREREVASAVAGATLGTSVLGSFLGGRWIETGEGVRVPADVGQRVLGLFVSDVNVQSLELTLIGDRKQGEVDAAAFCARARLATTTTDHMPLTVHVTLDGEFLVAKESGLILSIQLTGPVTMTAAQGEGETRMTLDGSGKWTIDYTARIQ